MSRYPQSVVFWGAGATASIGLPLTARQAEFLRSLAPHFDSGDQPLERRVRDALGDLAIAPWDGALSDLLAILGDDDNNVVRPGAPTNVLPNQFTAMTRNWPSAGEDALRQRIVELRTLYDWPALAAAINVCPKQSDRSSFELQDLFNVLDMNLQTGHGFRVHDDLFLTPQRVLGARGALVLLIQALFYIAWHARGRTHENLEHHHDFAKAMARRMQREGVQLAADLGDEKLETDDFIRGDVAFVSMNWDPLGLWPQFVANGELNRDRAVPRVGSPAKRLQIFHDLGHFVGGPRVKKKDRPGSRVWQPMNESSARQLNDPDHEAGVRIRVSKYLFPHGCLWWRECPNCGKLSSYIGDEWAMSSATLLPPPPLKAFQNGIDFGSWTGDDAETAKWTAGEVDARACVHCRELTYAHHTPLVVQSNLKGLPPPFLQEIQRDMRVVVQHAAHVIFMGYSLPSDDVTYRAFLAARTARTGERPKCSVVGKINPAEARWLYPDELDTRTCLPKVVESTRALFGRENVRFYGAGVPQVFLGGGGTVTDAAVERLLNWD